MNYVVAVSGGVDSVVLLDMIAVDEIALQDVEKVIVAHFEHGIRDDSADDANRVKEIADRYGYDYEIGYGKLGASASEEVAREARYSFLRRVCKKYNATLVTAHHKDDVLETMIINLLRGTNWRGLVSLQSSDSTLRPLLHLSKRELVEHANRHNLEWSEDSTNQDETYLRNYIRLRIIPKISKMHPGFANSMLAYQAAIADMKPQINAEINALLDATRSDDSHFHCARYRLIMWPKAVTKEYIYAVLTQLDPTWHPERHHIERALNFVKTAKSGSTLKVNNALSVTVSEQYTEFQNI